MSSRAARGLWVASVLACASLVHAGGVPTLTVGGGRLLERSDANAFDAFGSAMASTGDRLLVGCRGADGVDSNEGAVYAFQLDSNRRLVETQRIVASDERLRSEFGHSIAAFGSVAAVGVPLGGVGGAVGVLQLVSGQWVQGPILERAGGTAASGDGFGSAVALGSSGRLAIGVPGATVDDLESAGAVELRTAVGSNYVLTTTFSAPIPAAGDRFGASVAISGDWLAVGAPFDDVAGEDAGAVHIYRRLPTGAWVFSTTLRPPTGEVFGYFGRRVAMEGTTLVIGGPRLDSVALDRGAVYIYQRAASLWIEQAVLTPDPLGGVADFGDAVAFSSGRVVVGAPGNLVGSVMVFEQSGSEWSAAIRFEPASPGYTFLGTSVALVDGVATMGAPLDSSSATYAGSTFEVDLLADCDGDGTSDALELASGEDVDINGNAVPDGCEPCLVTSLLPASATVAASGGAGSVSIATSGEACTWQAVASDAWLSITAGGSGSGSSGTIAYAASANLEPFPRIATIEAGGQVHTVTQQAAACVVTGMSPSTASFTASGGLGAVTVTTNGEVCGWSATSSDAWLTITSGGIGSGASGTISYEVAVNSGTSPRTASISAGGQVHTITQDAAACAVTAIDPTTLSVPASGGAYSVAVTTNGPVCGWSASPSAGWIVMGVASGTGSGSATFTVLPNTSTASRSGTVSVGGLSTTVTQQGAGCSVTGFSPSESEFTFEGGSRTILIATNGSGCSWAASTSTEWIAITSGGVGTGVAGQLTFTVGLNPSLGSRVGTIVAGGEVHVVMQSGAPDCNGNGIGDPEEVATGVTPDCNLNGIPDDCDIAAGSSFDQNGDGIPDECQGDVVVGVPSDFPNIQSAIDAAEAGWIIRVAAGVYSERLDFRGKAIVVESVDGAEVTTIDGSAQPGSVVQMSFAAGFGGSPEPTLRGFTIRGGTVGSPLPGSALTGGGGVALINAATALVEGCIIEGNSAQAGGGIVAVGGAPRIRECRIESNVGLGNAGGAWLRNTNASLEDCDLITNNAGIRGGGVFAEGGASSIIGTVVQGNLAGTAGGGVAWGGVGGSLNVSESIVAENISVLGGGIWIQPGLVGLQLGDTEVCDNEPDEISGDFVDLGGNDICVCNGDLNADGQIDGADLALLLGYWGECGNGNCVVADLNADGVIGGADLAILLGSWGLCGG